MNGKEALKYINSYAILFLNRQLVNSCMAVGYGSEGISSLKRIVRLRVGLRCRNLRKGDGITKMSDLTHSRMRANETRRLDGSFLMSRNRRY
jgi:hypothetical protein